MRRLIAVCALVTLLVFLGSCWWNLIVLRVRVGLADDQTLYFEEMLTIGSRRDRAETVLSDIEAVRRYYPSGTKQPTGSRLDRIVERARSNAVSQLQSMADELRQQEEQP